MVTVLWALLCLLLGAVSGHAAVTVEAPTGIRAVIHGPDDLAPYLHLRDGSLWLEHPRWGTVELLTGVDDPRLPRRDVTAFVPLPADGVAAALREVRGISPSVEVDVLLLPSLPAATLGSFARRDVVFLAPALDRASTTDVAWVTTHELGHVLTWAYFDPRPDLWRRYMDLRGLDPVRNGPDAPHAERAREILAEDIRSLFGGPIASAVAIENHALAGPDEVDGLEAFLATALAGPVAVPTTWHARVFPNPCNPGATIEARLDGPAAAGDLAGTATVELYDTAGRHLRTIPADAFANQRALFRWDGRDDGGTSVASGTYLFRVRWQGGSATGRLLLVK